jgi:hypothetical protein
MWLGIVTPEKTFEIFEPSSQLVFSLGIRVAACTSAHDSHLFYGPK